MDLKTKWLIRGKKEGGKKPINEEVLNERKQFWDAGPLSGSHKGEITLLYNLSSLLKVLFFSRLLASERTT